MNIIVVLVIISFLLGGVFYLLDKRSRSKFIHVKTGKSISGPNILTMLYTLIPLPWRRNLPIAIHIHNLMKKYAPEECIMLIPFGGLVQIGDPEALKIIFRDYKKFPKLNLIGQKEEPTTMDRFMGKSIVFVEGEEWRKQRHVMNPAFFRIDKFLPVFESKAQHCLTKFSALIDKNGGYPTPISVNRFMTDMTVDILGKCVFDYEFNALDAPNKYVDSYDFLFKNINNLSTNIFPFLLRLPTQHNRQTEYHLQNYDELMYNLIADARKKAAKDINREKVSLLDMMLESEDETGKKFTDKEMRDNLSIFFVAGHETTATALAFEMFMLAKRPDIQNKIVDEINDKIGSNKVPTYEELASMEYLSLFINEVLRAYNPAGMVVPRIASEDCVLAGYRIPKGSIISPHLHSAHYHPCWGDPENFRPERFLHEESKNRPKFAYVPFAAGPRTCIGNIFSLVEQKCFLVDLLQKFTLSLEPDVKEIRYSTEQLNLVNLDPEINIIFARRK